MGLMTRPNELVEELASGWQTALATSVVARISSYHKSGVSERQYIERAMRESPRSKTLHCASELTRRRSGASGNGTV